MFKRARIKGKEFGFGNSAIGKNQRILNKDGSFNVKRNGLSIFDQFSFFHWMINTRWSHFLGIVVLCFFLSNAFFSFIYCCLLGTAHFHGMETNTPWGNYFELFFFSSQTYATVGYGRINPATNLASFVAAVDALAGARRAEKAAIAASRAEVAAAPAPRAPAADSKIPNGTAAKGA